MYKYVNYVTVIVVLATSPVVLGEPSVTTSTNDPMVMKVYPDGTKVVVRWSEIGKAGRNNVYVRISLYSDALLHFSRDPRILKWSEHNSIPHV